MDDYRSSEQHARTSLSLHRSSDQSIEHRIDSDRNVSSITSGGVDSLKTITMAERIMIDTYEKKYRREHRRFERLSSIYNSYLLLHYLVCRDNNLLNRIGRYHRRRSSSTQPATFRSRRRRRGRQRHRKRRRSSRHNSSRQSRRSQ
ncbi:hypothetical protein DERP_008404 [Dermatophagoides pteronyssinus]|uniref:Uncharacterized protein n=1 Tax=Dermatophagoides pteronyssinus TaxID=6956 RepID=A0ABQ8IV65_DERPT|nr:hypothetical protein DERP_008404 [Dermatophagoides pteronyssinus]